MSNATKTLASIFIVLGVLTALIDLTSGPTASKALRQELVSVDTSAINKMVIERPTADTSIILSKKNTQWNIEQGPTPDGQTYPAAGDRIRGAMGELNNLDIKAVVTRQEENYPRYKVDSTGTKVTLYKGDSKAASIILGAPQMQSRRQINSYVRPAGEKEVYTVSGFVSRTFNREWSAWRNKTVWNLNRNSVQHIEFRYPADSSFTITKAGPNSWVAGDDTVAAGSRGTIIDKVSRLEAEGFKNEESVDAFSDPLYTLRVQLDNGEVKTIKLKPDSGTSGWYKGIATGYPYVFTLNKNVWDSQVLKSRSSMLKK